MRLGLGHLLAGCPILGGFGRPRASAANPGLRRSSATARSDRREAPDVVPRRLPSAGSAACSGSGVTSTLRTSEAGPLDPSRLRCVRSTATWSFNRWGRGSRMRSESLFGEQI